MLTIDLPTQKTKQKINKWNKLDDTTKWQTFNKELAKEYNKITNPTYEESYNLIHKILEKVIGRKTITISGKPRRPDSVKHLVEMKKQQKKLLNTECRVNGPNKQKRWDELKTTISRINLELNRLKEQKNPPNNKPANQRRRVQVKKFLENQENNYQPREL